MIRVAVLYPNEAGKKFDMDYYLDRHMPMVNDTLSKLGLVRTEVDKGVTGLEPGSPPPFFAIGYMYFNDMDALQKGMTKGNDLMSDIPNFTDTQPQMQISEIA